MGALGVNVFHVALHVSSVSWLSTSRRKMSGLWNLLLGAKKLILVSFLRPQVEGHRAYEKAGICQSDVHF